jgi:hypothetical protein
MQNQEIQEIQEIKVQEVQESEEEYDRVTEICATIIKYITFKIPEGLNLLPEEECGDCKKPFSWWIRREKLYYINANGKTKCLEYNEECTNKDPDGIDVRYE